MEWLESIRFYINELASNIFLKLILTSMFFVLWFCLGDLNGFVYALFCLYVLNFILGFGIAFRHNNINKNKLQWWIFKFFTYSLAVITGNLVDMAIFWHNMSYGWKRWIIVYLSINEAIKIFNKLIVLNVNLPKNLIKKLENYKKSIDNYDLPPNKEKNDRDL